MPEYLIYGDTVRSPAMRHEVPLGIGDPFLYLETDGRRVVVTNPLEDDRIAEAAPDLERLLADELGLDGSEVFDITGLQGVEITPRQDVTLRIRKQNGDEREIPLTLRIDTPIEIEYYRHGGILPFVLRQLIAQSS